VQSQPGAQLLHDDELRAARGDSAMQRDAAQPHARASLADDEAVSLARERMTLARVLRLLAAAELHAQTIVRHGCDAKHAQPDVRHVVTWSGFSQMLFYFSERGLPGPRSFSSRRLYRKKPDKLG